MKISNVKLIYLRELRDQLRDRRTLFTIAVLPVLLYPLLGMSFMQVAQFMKEHPTRIRILGADNLPEQPALIVDGEFAADFCSSSEARLLDLEVERRLPKKLHEEISQRVSSGSNWSEAAMTVLDRHSHNAIQNGEFDAIIYFPPEFAGKLAVFRERLATRDELTSGEETASIPQPLILANMAVDKSRMARTRVSDIVDRWHKKITEENLEAVKIPIAATQPFEVVEVDVAVDANRRAAIWSKILPFVVLVWALTGAFYPAIDLCAGEKERGTLETLLSSPAQRIEIVWGKLLTIMTFSIATSLLNMASMGFTGFFLINQLAGDSGVMGFQIGPPPIASMAWLVVALIPISALFSALSLAIAAFARSSKEGQYYLMPLLLISLPLMMLPMLPAAELDLGTSLIPVTGMILLLRKLIEGQYLEALRFALPVVSMTGLCCWLAAKWAVNQFNNESVLFRESERWGIGLWFRHLVRDRGDTPTVGEALLCGVLLLVIRFFAGLTQKTGPTDWSGLAMSTLVMQVAFIATPALLMAIMLTRSPRTTLKLRLPVFWTLPAAVLLAVVFHPLGVLVAEGVQLLYPLSDAVKAQGAQIEGLIAQAPNFWVVLALFALTPAICEELAFRGFILSGLEDSGRKWTPIVVASVFFGVTHFLLQQSITACVVGVVIGYLVFQTRSLLPGVLFHMTYNAISVSFTLLDQSIIDGNSVLSLIFKPVPSTHSFMYHWSIVGIGGAATLGLLLLFRSLTREQESQDDKQQSFEPAAKAFE